MRLNREPNDRRASQLAATGAVAALAFGIVALGSATRAAAHIDRKTAPRLALRPRSRGRRVAERLSPLGKWHTLVPGAAITGAVVARATGRPAAGVTIAASPVVATLLGELLDRVLPQPPVPANQRHEPRKAVFPSGHGLLATSTALTAAYVISREELADGAMTFPPAIVFSLLNPALKLGVRKHWLSDAVGGVAAGVAVAAMCCALYELTRGERNR